LRATKKEEVRPVIDKALSTDKVVFMDFQVEPEENVFPMVPAGEAIDRMIGGMA
jgi:acetolactate synthase-1/2/3 large subunit